MYSLHSGPFRMRHKRWRAKYVGEDWAFATKLTDLCENFEDENENGFPELEIFQVKFLGCSTIHAAKSEAVTANTIKSIITAAKVSNKKLQRLKLSICPKGIETFDAVTGETLHKVSIYQISYCSADAAHSNVFAFIAGTGRANDSDDEMCNNDSDELTCYAFLCAKRKIAYNLTITTAKNFERAYDMWKKSKQRKVEQCESERLNGNPLPTTKSNHSNVQNSTDNHIQSDAPKNLLIDFNSDIIAPVERQRLLQTAWVSFDDEPLLNNDSNNDDPQPMHGKIFKNNLWDMNIMCL
ncbi:low density lipoprotein receptor adapter protein 1-like isoform X2 [Sitodiplosis mosellana]|uniref:low density lipoprotein receptor adapter protein 1-like isoform X2 n=1 Tax=Sitodiplosis mosellana TaxID=263140 RepID=UPI002443BBE5|nr:low density lipoprotein receptor adapter protein 1-like isoform X2 [Sitodiplosis mosellana]